MLIYTLFLVSNSFFVIFQLTKSLWRHRFIKKTGEMSSLIISSRSLSTNAMFLYHADIRKISQSNSYKKISIYGCNTRLQKNGNDLIYIHQFCLTCSYRIFTETSIFIILFSSLYIRFWKWNWFLKTQVAFAG